MTSYLSGWQTLARLTIRMTGHSISYVSNSVRFWHQLWRCRYSVAAADRRARSLLSGEVDASSVWLCRQSWIRLWEFLSCNKYTSNGMTSVAPAKTSVNDGRFKWNQLRSKDGESVDEWRGEKRERATSLRCRSKETNIKCSLDYDLCSVATESEQKVVLKLRICLDLSEVTHCLLQCTAF